MKKDISKIKTGSKLYVLIDASNVWNAIKSARKFIDYKKLKDYFENNLEAKNIRFFYYDAFPEEGTREYDVSKKHNFYTYLKKGLGFTVRKKKLKLVHITNDDGEKEVKEKGNMDVEMTIDLVEKIDEYDAVFLFSGDVDFLALANYLKRHNKKIYIFSTKGNISNELKTGGSGYFELKDMKCIWGKELVRREKQNHPQ
jgi:uncharacterized LabA/DUF88 family protein